MTARPDRCPKRRAACASHASRLVKCDVLKVRPDPLESRRCSAFPSVPPTKSGEFAHVKSDRPTRWRFLAEACHESLGRAPNQARTCVRVLLQQTPKAVCALPIALCRCTGLCPRCHFGTSTNGVAPVQKLWSLWVSCGKGRKSRKEILRLRRLEVSLACGSRKGDPLLDHSLAQTLGLAPKGHGYVVNTIHSCSGNCIPTVEVTRCDIPPGTRFRDASVPCDQLGFLFRIQLGLKGHPEPFEHPCPREAAEGV